MRFCSLTLGGFGRWRREINLRVLSRRRFARRRFWRRFGAGGVRRRRSANVGRHDVDRFVAAERTERIAKRLVGARSNLPIALEGRRRIDPGPGRRRAGDLLETGARIAEQFLLRHRRIGLRRIRRRLRRLRRRRAPLIALSSANSPSRLRWPIPPQFPRSRRRASRRSARRNPSSADSRPLPEPRECPSAPSPAPRLSPD